MSTRKPSDKAIPAEVVLKNRVDELEKALFVEREMNKTMNASSERAIRAFENCKAELKTARESISALKGELVTAKEQIARQHGYLQRVHDDDLVRELGATVPAPAQPVVPRREPPHWPSTAPNDDNSFNYRSTPKPTDWWDR